MDTANIYTNTLKLRIEAKHDTLTNKILSSPKWKFVTEFNPDYTYPYQTPGILVHFSDLRLKYENIILFLQKNYIQKDLLPKDALEFTPDIMPDPATLDKYLTLIIESNIFFEEINKTISKYSEPVTVNDYVDRASYEKAAEERKTELKLVIDEETTWKIFKQHDTLTHAFKDLKAHSKSYRVGTSSKFLMSKKTIKKWEIQLLNFYKQELLKNPNNHQTILELPKSLTNIDSSIKNITEQAEALNVTTEQPKELKNKDIPLKNVLVFPETTTSLYSTALKKRKMLSLINNQLTTEEQYTIEAIFNNHIPEILNTLETFIQIESQNITEATTNCNNILTESIQKLDALIERIDKKTYTTMLTQTKSIKNMLTAT